MAVLARYILLTVTLLLGLHFILRITHETYGRVTSLDNIRNVTSTFTGNITLPFGLLSPNRETPPPPKPEEIKDPFNGRANATMVMLARNSDLHGALSAIRQLEDRFNGKHGYPYVFLNDEEFTEEFQEKVKLVASGRVEFGVIPKEHWLPPDWIDDEKYTEARQKLVAQNVKYGDSKSYRNMCRFNSGFFFRHPLMQKYKWYWRVEPSVKFHCTIHEDPFKYLEKNNKTYGFTIAVYEIRASIPTLWNTIKSWTEKSEVKKEGWVKDAENALGWISSDGGRSYNTCHFWSNFEIADMDFWRSPAYQSYFNHLDHSGGFYYERWGDAPVHSIAASLLLPADKIHFFENIGYQHDDWAHCPTTESIWTDGQCSCERDKSFDYDPSSCKRVWDRFVNERKEKKT